MVKKLRQGDLTITLDTDRFIAPKRDLKTAAEYYTSKNYPEVDEINESIVEKEIDDLIDIATNITSGHLGMYGSSSSETIFDYIPLTKSGKFNKSKTILVAQTSLYTQTCSDCFSLRNIQLFISPNYIDGDKNATFLIGSCAVSGTPTPLIKDGVIKKIEPKERNSYIKEKDLEAGSIYADAKGKEFLYVVHYYLDYGREYGKNLYPNEETYLKSENYERFREDYVEDECCRGHYIYIKVTKKAEKVLASCKTLDDFFEIYFDDKRNGDLSEKYLENPLKVVSKSKRLFEKDLTKNFYYYEEPLGPSRAFLVEPGEPEMEYGYNYVVKA